MSVKNIKFVGLESLKDVVFTDEAIGGIEKDVLQILTKDGPEATIKYISDTFNSWKRTTVRIAVAGKSAVGKSAFINTVRGVNNTDQGYAAEGLGDTTMEVQEYPHPINKQIIYCDLPGYGTVTMTKEKFLEKVKLLEFDMFFIFIYPVPTQDDEWLVEQLIKAGRQFCFVRGKLDRDIKNAKKMGKKEENVIEEIRKKIQDSTKNMPSSKGVDIFCISNKNTSVGEIHDLINFLKGKIPTIKFEAVMFSLPALVDKVIEIKYTILKDRVSSVSLEIVLETISMGLDVIDISAFNEIILYFETFLLNNNKFSKIPNLKHPFSDQHIRNTLLLDLQNKVTGGFKRLIPFYNLFACHRVCKQFLIKLLDELKEDCQTVHRFLRLNQIQCTKQNV